VKNYIIGIGGYLGHDANAALIINQEVQFAAQEERYSRIKHDLDFPINAIQECLSFARIRGEDVTDVAFAEKPIQAALHNHLELPFAPVRNLLGRSLPNRLSGRYVPRACQLFPNAQFHFVLHHVSHVAGAFVSSPFEEAAFLCVDGKGEDYSATVGHVSAKGVEIARELPWENGLGLLYTIVTSYLGFRSFGSEYKVMGLAPYGTPRFVDKLLTLCDTDANGALRIKHHLKFDDPSTTRGIRLVEGALGVAPRAGSDALRPDHVDIAASIQRLFEDEIMKMVRFSRTIIDSDNLLFCGGCAQNCVAAGAIRRSGIFKNVYNSPVGGDMGSGLGAACFVAGRNANGITKTNVRGFYLGSEPGEAPEESKPHRIDYTGSVHQYVASEIANGKTVGWVRGRMELGARALGARSILADPRVPGMQSKLNLAVKFRESFRPFAPAILAEHLSEWFDTDDESDYMNYTAYLLLSRRLGGDLPNGVSLKEKLDFTRSEIQSVIHVDFSARLQTVRKEVHPDFYELINAFYGITGVPILINTSFNVSGQPIVRTASEAWQCFLHTNLDLLVINDDVFSNPNTKSMQEKQVWLRQFSSAA
jgi:carbamoyltransferase